MPSCDHGLTACWRCWCWCRTRRSAANSRPELSWPDAACLRVKSLVSAELCRDSSGSWSTTAAECLVAQNSGPRVGGGARLENLSATDQARMQSFANRYQSEVTVVGSRAGGTAGPMSDYDYLIGGNSRLRANARNQLPRGAAGGEIGPRGETGIDVFNLNREPLDPNRPHIIFAPEPKPGG